jgi:hypothetical protein
MTNMTTRRELKDVELPTIFVCRRRTVLANAAGVIISVGEEGDVQSVLHEVFGEDEHVTQLVRHGEAVQGVGSSGLLYLKDRCDWCG